METKTLKLSGTMVNPYEEKIPSIDGLKYSDAVETITTYRKAGGKIGKMDLFNYSSILALLFKVPKEQTMDDLTTAWKNYR